jgi:hypothetical protein
MVPRAALAHAPPAPGAAENRARFGARKARLAQQADSRAALLSARKESARADTGH